MRRRALFLLWLCLAIPAWPAPPVKVSVNPAALTVPLGESRAARWTGPAAPGLEVADPAVAEAWLEGSRIVVRGLAAGDTSVTLLFPDRMLDVPVRVRRPAASFPATLNVSLTGRQVGQEVLRQAIEAALNPAPGAQVSYSTRSVKGQTILDVAASGPGLLATSGSIRLEVTLQEMDFAPARTLAVSNRPELVGFPGVLLERPLPAGPSRLLVHHRGSPDYPSQDLEVVLRNVNATPARVRVTLAMVGPSPDEIYVGHLAAQRMITMQQKGESFVLRIPPGGQAVIDRRRLKAGWTVSGMGWLEPLDGAQVRVVVRAVEDGAPPTSAESPEVRPARTGRGLFSPAVDLAYAHHAGGPFTFIPLGEQPYETDPETGESNPGNFGMVYRVQVHLYNPTAETRQAWIDFVPRAGPARGSLFVDGERVETDMGTHAEELRLGEWELAPGEERDVWIETFPQSGSNYPVFLVVKSEYGNGTVPAAPPRQATPSESRYIY
ncbi:MAG: hypothetical protein AB1758_08345 [Candidatus Eremiobacterota bacterium]